MASDSTGKGSGPALRGDGVPPSDVEAERSVLGAMMLSAEAANVAREMLIRDDFYRPAHSSIFAAMSELFLAGEPTDPITICDQLTKMGLLDQVGGRAAVHGLVDNVPSAANISHYAEIVVRTSTQRALIHASQEIAALGNAPSDNIDLVLGTATEVLFNVVHRRMQGRFAPLKDLVSDAYEYFENAFGQGLAGLRTGFPGLDETIGGLRTGELVVLAARPSVGKTALALNIAESVAEQGRPVAVFSLEMSGRQLAQRMMCSRAEVDLRQVLKGVARDEDWSQLMNASNELSDLPIHVDDSSSVGIGDLRTKVRRLFSMAQPGLVIVDYMQLMAPTKRLDNRQQEIAEISRGLKLMAKELDSPVLALSQLNRAVETRTGTNKRPMLSDLRESGAIEQDADVVMFLHRDRGEDDEMSQGSSYETEVIVAKNRNGAIGDVTLTFVPEYTKFK
jgi:replicative DNA helicase